MDIDVFIWNSQENRTPMSKTLSGKRVISEASPFDQWWEIQFIGSVAPAYEIYYTQTAEQDILEEFSYILHQFRDPALAETWYTRLRETIQSNLS